MKRNAIQYRAIMRLFKTYDFGQGIRAYRLGWSLAGPPLMTVYCYGFGDILMDTGQSHMGREVVGMAREQGVERIYLTHHHEDHSGNAAAVRAAIGADVFGHELARKKLTNGYPILPYQKYVWGKTTPVAVGALPDEIETPLGPMQPIHTPGHAKDHTVYFLPEQGVVFAGDLYLADRIKFFRSDEDIGLQIESLQRVAALEFDVLLCCHYPKRKNGREHIRQKLAFLEDLYGRVAGLWEKGMPEKRIFRELKLKEDHFTKYFCFGNVSMINGVRSIVRHCDSRKPGV